MTGAVGANLAIGAKQRHLGTPDQCTTRVGHYGAANASGSGRPCGRARALRGELRRKNHDDALHPEQHPEQVDDRMRGANDGGT